MRQILTVIKIYQSCCLQPPGLDPSWNGSCWQFLIFALDPDVLHFWKNQFLNHFTAKYFIVSFIVILIFLSGAD